MNPVKKLAFEDDKLGLESYSKDLERYLMVESQFVDGSLVVSLDAPFGTGKSTFISMWMEDLNQRRAGNLTLPKAIVLNAWESDIGGEPLLSVISALIKAADEGGVSINSPERKRLKEAAKDAAWFFTALANNITSAVSGIDAISAAEFAEGKKKGREPEIPDFVKMYEYRMDALKKLKSALREIFGGEQPKLFVLVDELDRCRPDFAVSYLETIKHVFDIKGLVFVLAVDSEQMACSVRTLYGALNFPEYFRKFVQRNLSLPAPHDSGLGKLARHYALTYLFKEGSRYSLINLDDRLDNITELLSKLKMTPRQMQEVFRTIGHVASGQLDKQGRLPWTMAVGVILLCALKLSKPALYQYWKKYRQS